jgi:hypothetical protein
MTSVQERVRAAGADLVAFIKSDAPAAGLEEFVSKYFPLLSAHPVGDDLLVENNRQQRTYVRRDAQQAHGGWVGLTGSHKFRTSEMQQLLDVGGGAKRDPKGLIDELAVFSNPNNGPR